MTAILVRVEIPRLSNYEPFHSEMEKRGLKRTIRGADGNDYDLPRGTYLLSGSFSVSEAVVKTNQAASTVGVSDAEIFAAVASGIQLSGLKRHTSDRAWIVARALAKR